MVAALRDNPKPAPKTQPGDPEHPRIGAPKTPQPGDPGRPTISDPKTPQPGAPERPWIGAPAVHPAIQPGTQPGDHPPAKPGTQLGDTRTKHPGHPDNTTPAPNHNPEVLPSTPYNAHPLVEREIRKDGDAIGDRTIPATNVPRPVRPPLAVQPPAAGSGPAKTGPAEPGGKEPATEPPQKAKNPEKNSPPPITAQNTGTAAAPNATKAVASKPGSGPPNIRGDRPGKSPDAARLSAEEVNGPRIVNNGKVVPFGFKSAEQYNQAMTELDSAMKASGIDGRIGARGSAVTGVRSPKKAGGGGLFDSGKDISDIDVFIEARNLRGSTPRSPFTHPAYLQRQYPALQKWSQKWTKELGRPISVGGWQPGSLPRGGRTSWP